MISQSLVDSYILQKDRIMDYRNSVSRYIGYRDSIVKSLAECTSNIENISNQLVIYGKVTALLQAVSEYSQLQITKIESICSDALKEILDDPDIDFKIKTERKRNMVETYFYISDKKFGEVGLMHGEAGAVKNVISAGLRLIFLELYSPRIEGPILLDEVGSNLSADFQSSFGGFLKNFSNATGRQIILVSHQHLVIAEASQKIIVSRNGLVSKVEYENT